MNLRRTPWNFVTAMLCRRTSATGTATFGGVLHRVFGITMDATELAEYNAFNEYLNQELAAGRNPYDNVPPTAEELKRYNKVRKAHGLPATTVIVGGPDLDNAEESDPSALSRPSCPRGDSNTRHAV